VIKVAFWYDRPQEYSGGLNYFRNLLYALSRLENPVIDPYVFFGSSVDSKITREFETFATVVCTRLLDRNSLAWILQRILFKYLGSLTLINWVVRRHGIQLVSHGVHVYGKARPFLVVHWLPDFQYLHLPELFPQAYVAQESNRIRAVAAQSDAILLSSYSALADFRQILGSSPSSPVTVLPFVSQPTIASAAAAPAATRSALIERYGLMMKFFYLPNQFWSHKNHLVVFEAVRLAKEHGVAVAVVCTGNLKDYRSWDNSYANMLFNFIATNQLEADIRILGSIDYADVLHLMAECVAVINPSRFEGWSSTVEEARSLGKRLVLSDIPVHREQSPPRVTYFQPDDADELSRVLMQLWLLPPDGELIEDRRQAREDLDRRTREFAAGYTDLVVNLVQRAGR